MVRIVKKSVIKVKIILTKKARQKVLEIETLYPVGHLCCGGSLMFWWSVIIAINSSTEGIHENCAPRDLLALELLGDEEM